MFKVKKYIRVEFFIIIFWIFADLLQLLFILNTHILFGDFFPWEVTLSDMQIILLASLQILSYFLVYKFYFFFIKNKKLTKTYINLDKNIYKFLDYFFSFWVMVNIIYLAIGLTCPAGSYKLSRVTFIIHLLPIDILFVIYYILNRNQNNEIIYITNIILYLVLQLAKGWTGIILKIFFLEMYFRTKQKIHLKFLLLIPIIFISGVVLYQFAYPLKQAIRYGLSIYILPFSEAFVLLLNRLSMMGNMLAIFQYHSDILNLLNSFYPMNFEILKFFRAMIPSFIATKIFPLEVTYYGTIGSILWIFKTGVTPLYEQFIGFGPTLVGTSYLLLLRNPIELILFYLFAILVVFYTKFILDLFRNQDIYFLLFLKLVYFVHEAGELQMAFADMFVGVTSFFFLVLLAKAFIYTLRQQSGV